MDLNQQPQRKKKHSLLKGFKIQPKEKNQKQYIVKKKKKMIRNLNLIRKLCQFMRARCFNVQCVEDKVQY